MKAVRIHEYGTPDVLRVEQVVQPRPGKDEALVRIAASAFNPADIAIRSGAFAAWLPLQLPHVLGLDLAGTVAEIGADVTNVAVGDPVVAFMPPNLPGSAAEYAVVPAALLVGAPTSIPLPDAAALPSCGVTAWQALFEHGRLASGRRVLINGAGSVVGGYAVQLAVTAGAKVTAIAGAQSLSRITGYGASQVLDYSTTSLADLVQDSFDLVVNVAPTPFADLLPLVKNGGHLVSASSPVEDAPGITAIRMAAHPDAGQLRHLVGELDAGRLTLHIGDRRPLEDVADVHVKRQPGKTLLIP